MRLLIGAVPEGGYLVGDHNHGAAWAHGRVRDAGATRRIQSLASRAVREGVGPGIYRGRNTDEWAISRLKLALGGALQPRSLDALRVEAAAAVGALNRMAELGTPRARRIAA